MGVAYHAHARFLDAHGNKVTVAAPCDQETPDAPWWYDWIAAHASELRRAGFTAIMYPPVCKTQSGHYPTGDGYGVYDQYDLGSKPQCGATETRFGDRERLQRSIAIAHACGLDVYIDVVMHQLNGGDNGSYAYVGANGRGKNGRFPKDAGCFRGDPPRRPQDPVPVPFFDFAFGDELVYVNCEPPGYTTRNMVAFGDWLTRSLDLSGYRVDDTKGTAVAFVHEWMTSGAMASRFCVSEYFDGNPDSLWWWTHDSGMAGRSKVFDFTLHWALQAMCDDPSFHMSRMSDAGYVARDPFNAVTFVDNLDTDLSPGQQIVSNKLLAYAFVLTSEGYPFVSHKDYAQAPGCFGLKPWIDNLIWIHENLANGETVARWSDAKVLVRERTGAPGLLTAISTDGWNDRWVNCQTDFGARVQLHDYTGRHGDIWTDDNGWVSFHVPHNAFGHGQSYLCFSRADRDRAVVVTERATTQTFFGAADLDLPPCPASGTLTVGRVWCAAHKPIRATLKLLGEPARGGFATLRLLDANGLLLGTQRFDSDVAPHTLNTQTKTSGWHALELSGSGFTADVPYELEVHYTATQTLHV
jgi:alpha-amylase